MRKGCKRGGWRAVGAAWMMLGILGILGTLGIGVLAPQSASAQSEARQTFAPGVLSQWENWVRTQNPRRECPKAPNGAQECLALGPLWIEEGKDGFWRFWFEARNLGSGKEEARLPGDGLRWPIEARIGAEKIAIEERAGSAWVILGKTQGIMKVEGLFAQGQNNALPLSADARFPMAWVKELNGSWRAQEGAGTQIALRVRSASAKPEPVAQEPKKDGKEAKIEMLVSRKLTDGQVPELTTRVMLVNEGAKKAIGIQGLAPEGASPVALSGLSAKWEEGVLTVDAPTGRSQAQIVFRLNPDLKISFKDKVGALGAESPEDESWFVEGRAQLRRLSVDQKALDPKALRSELVWEGLPAYMKKNQEAFKVTWKKEEMGADKQPEAQSRVSVWADFDGGGSGVLESMQLKAQRSGLLTSSDGWTLRQARAGGVAQLVFEGEGGLAMSHAPGNQAIELFARKENQGWFSGWWLEAPATLAKEVKTSSTQVDFHMPASWRAIGVFGDGAGQSGWLAAFSLWDWFLLILTVYGAKRLLGWKFALWGLAGLALGKFFWGAPFGVFLVWMMVLALLGAFPAGVMKKALQVACALVVLAMAMELAPYSFARVQKTLHSSLEDPSQPGAGGGGMGWIGARDRAAMEESGAMSAQSQGVMREMDAPKAMEMAGGAADMAVSSVSKLASPAAPAARMAQERKESQRQALAGSQAGEGEPRWEHAHMTASALIQGPSGSAQKASLLVMGPWLSKLASILSLAGLWMLALGLLKLSGAKWRARPEEKKS